MKIRRNKLDRVWDKQKTLKENIITIFSMEFKNYSDSKSTGFFSQSQSEEQDAYEAVTKGLLNELEGSAVPLEATYAMFLFIQKANSEEKQPIKQFVRQINYVIKKMEESQPHLKDNQELHELAESQYRSASRFR